MSSLETRRDVDPAARPLEDHSLADPLESEEALPVLDDRAPTEPQVGKLAATEEPWYHLLLLL